MIDNKMGEGEKDEMTSTEVTDLENKTCSKDRLKHSETNDL